MHRQVGNKLNRAPRAIAASVTLAVALGVSACSTLDRNQHADALAAPASLHRETVQGGSFVFTTYTRIGDPHAPIHVYIEGDGLAWISRSEPSLDPTPREAAGLAIAATDSASNVVYLARPCQFTPMADNPACTPAYWTSKRYAPEVIDSMNAAISHIAMKAPGESIHLTGYSGGAAVAVLIAARRTDVASLRTVAGNLDDEYVNRLHHVSAMPDSLNAIDVADRVAAIPQIHFSGTDDTVVPASVATRFAQATGTRCAQVVEVPGLSHDGDWAARWPDLLKLEPSCRQDSAIHSVTHPAR